MINDEIKITLRNILLFVRITIISQLKWKLLNKISFYLEFQTFILKYA